MLAYHSVHSSPYKHFSIDSFQFSVTVTSCTRLGNSFLGSVKYLGNKRFIPCQELIEDLPSKNP